ncbi:MAG: sensor histidine kinase [Sulfitobacter sp.]
MTSGFFTGDLVRGLAVRVLFFLSLTLLPIGLIAVSQTNQIAEQNQLNAELSLIAVTEQASSAERFLLNKAFGAAEALASIISLHRHRTEACSAFFRAYREANNHYRLVGFIETSGAMECSSAQRRYDFSEDPLFIATLQEPSPRTLALQAGSFTQEPVTVVTSPVVENDETVGFIAIAIDFDAFQQFSELELARPPLALMTFNRNGKVITTDRVTDMNGREMPADVSLDVITNKGRTVFVAQNTEGVRRVYAVHPVVEDAVFAVSVWPLDTPFMKPSLMTRLGALVPIVMWAASLVVSFWALNHLAIRHIRKLVRQMRRFAVNRYLPRTTLGSRVPTELVEMEAAFINMGESILRDEAKSEDSLREKNILLKEVHHRVKNNLQLISSIMNMQIRQAKTKDASLVLRRLQDRILSLATVHKNLYQNDNLVRVDAKLLLRETVNQLLAVGLAAGSKVVITQNYTSISLDADNAAPLTLLVSEALTNALKHVQQEGSIDAYLSVNLGFDDDDCAQLTIENSKGVVPDQDGTGLGSRLIEAFARQLNGRIEVDETADTYALTVRFPVRLSEKQVLDY